MSSLAVSHVEKLQGDYDFWRYCTDFEGACMTDGLHAHIFNEAGPQGKATPTIAYDAAGALAAPAEGAPAAAVRKQVLKEWMQLLGVQMRALGGFLSIYDKWKLTNKGKPAQLGPAMFVAIHARNDAAPRRSRTARD